MLHYILKGCGATALRGAGRQPNPLAAPKRAPALNGERQPAPLSFVTDEWSCGPLQAPLSCHWVLAKTQKHTHRPWTEPLGRLHKSYVQDQQLLYTQ